MVDCPTCQVPIGEISREGRLTAVCPTCRYTFGVVAGRLKSRSSRQVTVRRQTRKQSGIYKRSYELRVETPGGDLEILAFVIDGKEDTIAVRRGDDVAMVASMRGGAVEEYVRLIDFTTATSFRLARPGDSARSAALGFAVAAAVVVFLIAWFGVDASFGGSAMSGLGAMAALYFGLGTVLAPRAKLDPGDHEKLGQAQDLLGRKRELAAKMAQHQADHADKTKTMQRLRALREKMASVGEELYGSRMVQVDRALAVLDKQRGLENRLVAEYERAIKIIEIEYETGQAANALPSELLESTLGKLDELESVERENRELQLQLEANEEVTRALR
ncbi:MAG: hypothetical protein R3F39_13975 [Myxococcota bacterium]